MRSLLVTRLSIGIATTRQPHGAVPAAPARRPDQSPALRMKDRLVDRWRSATRSCRCRVLTRVDAPRRTRATYGPTRRAARHAGADPCSRPDSPSRTQPAARQELASAPDCPAASHRVALTGERQRRLRSSQLARAVDDLSSPSASVVTPRRTRRGAPQRRGHARIAGALARSATLNPHLDVILGGLRSHRSGDVTLAARKGRQALMPEWSSTRRG